MIVKRRLQFTATSLIKYGRFFSTQIESGDKEVQEKQKEDSQVETYRKVDTTPKHLLHMTNEDFLRPDPELVQSEMAELIKEAREKIKPVIKAMSDEELNSILKTLEEAKADSQVIIHKERWYDVMDQLGITLEELRKIQDKHYEVDIEYELTRDLYEKQRIRDAYLEEHQEDNQLLNQYYSNEYFKAKGNKFRTLIYMLPYHAIDLRYNYRMMWFTTSVAAAGLAMVNPYLPILLTYDLYLLLSGTKVMNQTTNMIMLDKTKRHVFLNKLNFLGYETAMNPARVSLRDIKYIGEYENPGLSMNNMGILPSMSKFFTTDDADGEAKGQFRSFYKFMANNEVFLVAKDHPQHDEYTASEELLLHVIQGKQTEVMNYDFTEEEQIKEEILDKNSEEIKAIMEFKQVDFTYEIDQKKRAYSYFHPNREFSGKQEQMKLKKIDDGTFIDNGYR